MNKRTIDHLYVCKYIHCIFYIDRHKGFEQLNEFILVQFQIKWLYRLYVDLFY